MLDLLAGFLGELRAAGLPVSTVEAIDAAAALCHTNLGDRPAVRAALAATLVKSARYLDAFDLAFDIYFGSRPPERGSAAEAALEAADAAAVAAVLGAAAGGGEEGDATLLAEALFLALRGGDRAFLEAVARRAVRLLAGIEPGRPLGAAYYLYRVLRQLNAPHVRRRLAESATAAGGLEGRLATEEMARRFEEFRRAVEAEILRRLVADRGPETVARVLRRPLVEDIDLSAATTAELAEIERALHPLARRLAVRLSRRRRGDRGRLDVRRTLRGALSTGGVPADPRFRRPHRSKPEIVLLCDVSGSVATFARFTLQIVYALAAQFTRVQSFAFIDALDEVTGYFGPGTDFADGVRQMNAGARVVGLDGRSDYGRAFGQFVQDYVARLGPRTTVIVTGDARNNYRDPNTESLAHLATVAKHTHWLNPEPRGQWGTGDSAAHVYADVVPMHECRNAQQLAGVVSGLLPV